MQVQEFQIIKKTTEVKLFYEKKKLNHTAKLTYPYEAWNW